MEIARINKNINDLFDQFEEGLINDVEYLGEVRRLVDEALKIEDAHLKERRKAIEKILYI